MRIGICEDESSFAQLLSDKVESFFAKKEMLTEFVFFEKGKQLIDNFNEKFDLIFLDINLGGMNDGIEIAHGLRKLNVLTPLIFVTSLENRAVDGYDVNAYGFVVKKYLDEKLTKVLEKFWREYYCKKTIALCGKNVTEIVDVEKVFSVQSKGRCTVVNYSEGSFDDIRPIGKFSEILGEDFVETHKSVFVNISKIKCVNSDTLTLSDGSLVPLSRRNRKNVMYAVMKRIGGK